MRLAKIVTLFILVLSKAAVSLAHYSGPGPQNLIPQFSKLQCSDLKIPDGVSKDLDSLVNHYLSTSDESCAMSYALEIKKNIFTHPGNSHYLNSLNQLKKYFSDKNKQKMTDLTYFLQDFYFAHNMNYFGDHHSTWNNNKVRLRAATLLITYAVIIAHRKNLPTFLQNNVFDAKKLVINYLVRANAMYAINNNSIDKSDPVKYETVITDENSFYRSPMEILKNELGWSKYFYKDPLTYSDHKYEVEFASSMATLFGSIVIEDSVAFGTGMLMSALGFAETGAAISGSVATIAAFGAAYAISYYTGPYYEKMRFDSYYTQIENTKRLIISAKTPYEAHYYALKAMKQVGELYGIIYSRLWEDYASEVNLYSREQAICVAMTIPSSHVKPYPIENKTCVHTPYDPKIHGSNEYEVCKIHSLLMQNEPSRIKNAQNLFIENLRNHKQANSSLIDPFIALLDEISSLTHSKKMPEILQTDFSEVNMYKQSLLASRNTDYLAHEVIHQTQPIYQSVFKIKESKDYNGYQKLAEDLNCRSPYEDREFDIHY